MHGPGSWKLTTVAELDGWLRAYQSDLGGSGLIEAVGARAELLEIGHRKIAEMMVFLSEQCVSLEQNGIDEWNIDDTYRRLSWIAQLTATSLRRLRPTLDHDLADKILACLEVPHERLNGLSDLLSYSGSRERTARGLLIRVRAAQDALASRLAALPPAPLDQQADRVVAATAGSGGSSGGVCRAAFAWACKTLRRMMPSRGSGPSQR